MTKLIAAALVAIVLPFGAAHAASNCVFVHNVNDFKPAADEKSMIIRDSPSRQYTVSFMGRCSGLRFTEVLAVRAVGGRFCLTPGDSISFNDNGMRQRCMIDKVEPYSKPPSDTPAAEGNEGGG